MKKQFILILVIALLANSCLALRHKKRHNHRLFAQVREEGNVQNATHQELLDLDISAFSCENASLYRDYQQRMQDYVNFFSNDPVQQLLDSIQALGQAQILLKKVKQIFDLPEGVGALSQSKKNSKTKKDNNIQKLQQNLNSISAIINPEQVNKIYSAFSQISQSVGSNEYDEQAIQKIDEAITIIKALKQEFSTLLEEKDSFDAYNQQLSQKIEEIDVELQNCS